jgi:hypothetical protein
MRREDVLKLLAKQRAQFDHFGAKSLAMHAWRGF